MGERTLIAVLDWGLGHASRCVPLIRQLQRSDDELWIASAGPALQLLARECPEVPRYELPAYAVSYPTSYMAINMLLQGPRLLSVMWREHTQAAHLVQTLRPTRIISDGRFAFYNTQVSSIWLAHQLHIQYPFRAIQYLLNRVYHQHIRNNFQEIWVPDWPEAARSLAGKLAKPIEGIPHHYLGPLSRYTNRIAKTPIQYDWLCLLSGPEPQRSNLEKQIRASFVHATADSRILLVRGCPGNASIREEQANLFVVDWLHGQDLAEAVGASQRIICRSGYSSLMDLYFWQKPAILIPTPGQTEQLYLAKYWQQKGWAQNKVGVTNNLFE